MDCSPPGSSVHGIFQARILEGVAISSFRGSSQLRYEPTSPVSPALAGAFFFLTSEPPGKPHLGGRHKPRGFGAETPGRSETCVPYDQSQRAVPIPWPTSNAPALIPSPAQSLKVCAKWTSRAVSWPSKPTRHFSAWGKI